METLPLMALKLERKKKNSSGGKIHIGLMHE